MRRIIVGVVALLVAAIAPLQLVATPTARADDPVRILVYGDSISQGSSGDYTWRYFVDRHLRDLGVPFDMVGPRNGLHHVPGVADDDLDYAAPGFDTDHAASWGQALTTPVDDLSDLATAYVPDVVVALIGINDLVWQGVTPAAMGEVWRSKIADVRAASPGATVVLVQVPETWYAQVPPYNAVLVGLAAELDRPGARVVTTALPVFDKPVDTWDNTHPTASGDLKIAVAVENALARVGVGVPAGMVPVVANGPRRSSPLGAAPGLTTASLSWRDVSGVTQEWLERRDVTAGTSWYRYPYPFAAGTVTWTATGLVDAHRYEFRLRPAKGTAMSADVTSPVVSVVPGPRPPAPVLRTVTADAGGRLSATWAAAADATSYAVMLRDATRGEGWRAVGTTAATSRVVRGLVSGHRYEVRVRADHEIIEGATSGTAATTVPLLSGVRSVRVRSPRRDRVRATAASVAFATGYRVLVAEKRSCGRTPRSGAFRPAGADLARPVTTVRTRSRALWVRWYAVRDGVVGGLAADSTACTRVR